MNFNRILKVWFSFYKIEVTFMSPNELNILANDPIQKERCFSNIIYEYRKDHN